MAEFIRISLYLFAGPLFWAIHFIALYGFTGLVCARGWQSTHWGGIGLIGWGAGGLTITILSLLLLSIARLLKHPLNQVQERATRQFIRWSATTLGLLAMLAMVWETIPVAVLEHCR